MKYIAVVVSLFFLIMPLVAQDYVLADTESMPQEPPAEMYDAKPESDLGVVRERIDSDGEIAEGNHQVTVPNAKRPKKGDSEKIAELDNEDTEEDKEKRRDTIRFGLESEIIELIDELTKKEDARYADDIYDLFQDTKNITLKERILGYYAKLEDPCVEDYAIEILDDPYDEKQSTVNACFDYAKAVKTKEERVYSYSGGFNVKITPITAMPVADLTAGDFDGDGKTEIAFAYTSHFCHALKVRSRLHC